MTESASGDPNPYRAPEAAIDTRAELPIKYAGKWRRFFNWVIDNLVLFALTTALLTGLALLEIGHWVEWYGALGFWRRYLVDSVFVIAYYVALEGVFGISIGKLMTGTRVVNEQGNTPTLAQAVVRTLSRFIPFEALSLAFSDDDRARGWHDSLARTYVIRKR